MDIDSLLIFSKIFELKACYDNKHKSYFLTCLADLNSNSIYKSFIIAFENLLLKKSISNDEFKQWIEKNKFIEKYLTQVWELDSDFSDTIVYHFYDAINKQYIYVRISFNSLTDNIFFDPTQEHLLMGTKNIPNLYFSISKPLKENPYTKLDPSLVHYSYLAEALESIGYNKNQVIENFPQFIQHNKQKLDEIAKFFDFPPRELGAGVDGVAFAVSPKLVLKIFPSQHVYHEALKAMERLHKNPEIAKTEAMIYDVGILGKYNDRTFYYYIMERMTPVNSLHQDVSDALTTIIQRILSNVFSKYKLVLSKIKENISDPKIYKELNSMIKQIVDDIKSTIDNEIELEKEIIEAHAEVNKNWLNSLIEELIMKYLTSRTDLHLGNLGLTQYGEFRYFDPAYQNWKSDINFDYTIKNTLDYEP